MEIKAETQIGKCDQFLAGDGDYIDTSIVIFPLKLVERDNIVKIVWGCNLWRSCRNADCQFSQVAMDMNRKSEKGAPNE